MCVCLHVMRERQRQTERDKEERKKERKKKERKRKKERVTALKIICKMPRAGLNFNLIADPEDNFHK